ncbi:MAG: alpha/beta hydrolase [Chloroflexota bacterium]|nr:MAG: alpha/beta hydrolase [Chloroflexota bacterium]
MERYIETRGLRFRLVQEGAGEDPVLLLHGVHGSAGSWDALIDALNGAVPVFALDQRGHGGSSWPKTGYDVRTMAEDAAAICGELVVPINVVGHGMGAAVALILAAHHPNVVRRLVLSELPIDDQMTGAMTRVVLESPESFPSWESGRDFLAQRLVGVADDVIDRRTTERLQREPDNVWRWRSYLPGLRALVQRPMKGFDLWLDAPRILAPTVVVRGSRSETFPVETFERLARVIPGAEGFQIANAGQTLLDARPFALAHLLRGFLASGD